MLVATSVVGVTDGGVELGEVVLVRDDQPGEFPQPLLQVVAGDDGHGQTPQRRPGVLTGASHNAVSSSSSFSSVTEQPAISSEVM